MLGALIVAGQATLAQSWTPALAIDPPAKEASPVLRWVREYSAFRADPRDIQTALADAPQEITAIPNMHGVTLQLPTPDGRIQRFVVWENNLLGPQVQAQIPFFRTYSGQGIDDPHAVLRAEFGNGRFTAMVLGSEGTFFIEPLTKSADGQFFAYWRKDSIRKPDWWCRVIGEPTELPETTFTPRISGTTLYTFRLAVSGTGEYSQFHGNTTTAVSRVATSVNRVDGIYRRDLAIAFNLVFTQCWPDPATDPFTGADAGTMLGENIAQLGATPGNAAFDIGHVFHRGPGGVAFLDSVGTTNKAGGVSGTNSPQGDTFDVDYVAHEIGHQFGGLHCFNGVTGSCSGNRSASAAWEPGSASTIMGYAGICGAENVQTNSDAYFHIGNIVRMLTIRNRTQSNGIATSTGNAVPTVNAGVDRTIPQGTPFRLTATGSDANGDPLTFTWEQFDLPASGTANAGPTTATTTNTTRPLFRSITGTSNPIRFFPQPSLILSNTYTNPFQFLPNVNRTMRFRAIARDNRSTGGGVQFDEVVLTVSGAPFTVTAPNGGESFVTGQNVNVTWTVGGGSVAPNVNVLLSTDGGNSYFNGTATVLASNVPNDGSQTVTLPATATSTARIFVEAADNIFFEVSNGNFSIVANSAPTLTQPSNVSIPEETPWTLQLVGSDPNAGQTLTYSLTSAPSGATVNPSTGLISWTPSEAQGPGSYSFTARVTDNGAPALSASRTFQVNVNEVVKTISGTVNFSGATFPRAGIPISIEIFAATGTTLLETDSATLNASGQYSFDGQVPAGASYRALIDAPRALARFTSVFTPTASGANTGVVTLILGDLNDDDVIDGNDINVALADFGNEGSNLPADVNLDGVVDGNDINVILLNFGQESDLP